MAYERVQRESGSVGIAVNNPYIIPYITPMYPYFSEGIPIESVRQADLGALQSSCRATMTKPGPRQNGALGALTLGTKLFWGPRWGPDPKD